MKRPDRSDSAEQERKISMQQGAALWATMAGVPRPHRGTLIRWAIKGVRGRRLRAERLGGRWFVAPSAIEEFLEHVATLPESCADRRAGAARAAQVQRRLSELDSRIARRHRGR